MSLLSVAPVHLARGPNAVAATVAHLATLGPRVLVVRGEVGLDRLGAGFEERLRSAGLTPILVRHSGPCSAGAVAELVAAAERTDATVVLAIGGGRVLDAAKAAADDAGLPYAAIPTSPATCAAVTAISVMYHPNGAYEWTRPVRRPPEIVALDPALLAAAPDRLLVAGILDAIAKVHEVRHTTGAAARRSATARAALAACDELESLLNEHAEAAVAPARHSAADASARAEENAASREMVAEACVLLPGLIGGLAGEEAKNAAAHPLHNALTALPGSHGSLHGELVAFGVLVQIALTGGGEAGVRTEAARYARLGLACHLGALGCGEVLQTSGAELAARTVAMEPIRQCFPEVDAEMLLTTIQRVDAWAKQEADADPTAS